MREDLETKAGSQALGGEDFRGVEEKKKNPGWSRTGDRSTTVCRGQKSLRNQVRLLENVTQEKGMVRGAKKKKTGSTKTQKGYRDEETSLHRRMGERT